MSNKIIQLSDSIANQIKAGEIVVRPASVVKELMENAIDAGATKVIVNILDGGIGLIQIIDNGCGMSPDDAVRAFDRHATSKITQVDDIYALHTFGFRGEALPSISSVAEVELKTRSCDDELGVSVTINGGVLGDVTAIDTPVGSQFAVKNLFYNVPARRKFIEKSTSAANKQIYVEFQRVAICNPQIEFCLYSNNSLVYKLDATENLRQRIVAIMGKGISENLLNVDVKTSVVEIRGFIGGPKSAKKSNNSEQFLFVNGRFFKSHYFQSAIIKAYQNLIPQGTTPSYFLYFTVDPARIDVNIHPQKTEVKFEEEAIVWQILNATVRESLAKFGALPMMDFNVEDQIEIPVYSAARSYREPSNYSNPNFNPFDQDDAACDSGKANSGFDQDNWDDRMQEFDNEEGWDELNFEESNVETEVEGAAQLALQLHDESIKWSYVRVNNAVIIARMAEGLTVIDLRRAQSRILYEMFLARINNDSIVTQQALFPETIELSADDYQLLVSMNTELELMGIDIEKLDNNCIILRAIPSDIDSSQGRHLIQQIIDDLRGGEVITSLTRGQRLAMSMSRASNGGDDKRYSDSQIENILGQISTMPSRGFTADGRKIMSVFSESELLNRLK